ncbi:hypothetical protein K8O92_26000 [Nocardia asteroides]|nr:hypothetical protein K8O92_26000 [Nocardia asteroides]
MPSLRVAHAGRDRLAEITVNLRDRIAEAKTNGWTGEVEGLQVSLNAAAAKLSHLDRISGQSTGCRLSVLLRITGRFMSRRGSMTRMADSGC